MEAKIAVLEDNPMVRTLLDMNITSVLPHTRVRYFSRIDRMIEHLKEEAPLDILFLDCELMAEDSLHAGVKVARWVSRHPDSVKRVFIHSCCETGSALMLDLLGDKAIAVDLTELETLRMILRSTKK